MIDLHQFIQSGNANEWPYFPVTMIPGVPEFIENSEVMG